MTVEDGEDDGFAVVGRKGRAVPRAARFDLAVAPRCQPGGGGRPPAKAWPGAVCRPCLSVAPMMEWTDLHYRTFARCLTKRSLLFTEMLSADCVIAAERDGHLAEFLGFVPEHRPLAVQLGGCCPLKMAQAAALCARAGFDEINLNVGCPSPKVTCNNFGACLMKEPQSVRDIANAVRVATLEVRAVPITVKHRLGVDDHDSWEQLTEFVRTVSSAGVTHFVVHARKALLGVLSPEGNRTIPPLRYDWVFALAATFPHLSFELNGGVLDLPQAKELLSRAPDSPLNGVMIGRAAYNSPWILSTVDSTFFNVEDPGLSRLEVLRAYLDHASAFFHEQQRRGQVPTSLVALELERVLAAPIASLFEGACGEFRGGLLAEVEGRALTDKDGSPPFLLRSAAEKIVQQFKLD